MYVAILTIEFLCNIALPHKGNKGDNCEVNAKGKPKRHS